MAASTGARYFRAPSRPVSASGWAPGPPADLIRSRHSAAGEAGAGQAAGAGSSTGAAAPSVLDTVVRAEPLRPPNFSRYVTRPDLTPVGVSVNATPQLLALGRSRRLYFLRPQEPTGGQPGT